MPFVTKAVVAREVTPPNEFDSTAIRSDEMFVAVPEIMGDVELDVSEP